MMTAVSGGSNPEEGDTGSPSRCNGGQP